MNGTISVGWRGSTRSVGAGDEMTVGQNAVGASAFKLFTVLQL